MRAFIITLIFISVIYSTTTYAQQRDVELTGMVTDHQGEPLPGVTIRVRNTQFGTVTDTDGRYLLRGRWKEGEIIVFSFVGMKDVRIKYSGQKVQDAAMQQDTKSLDEVVIVAKSNINELDIRAKSGVVQRVDMERLNSKPMIDMSLALQGTVPGLIVTNTGDLGSKPKILGKRAALCERWTSYFVGCFYDTQSIRYKGNKSAERCCCLRLIWH